MTIRDVLAQLPHLREAKGQWKDPSAPNSDDCLNWINCNVSAGAWPIGALLNKHRNFVIQQGLGAYIARLLSEEFLYSDDLSDNRGKVLPNEAQRSLRTDLIVFWHKRSIVTSLARYVDECTSVLQGLESNGPSELNSASIFSPVCYRIIV